jgi:methylmalonyl-CoA mutase N-terminal domain/subunit
VGVNAFEREDGAATIPLLKVGEEAAQEQYARLAALRAGRDARAVERALARLRDAAASTENVLPALLDAARADCTLFEIRSAMESVFGHYQEPVFF